MGYFEFFDIEIQFYPDLAALGKKFKANTLSNHPDLNEGSEEAELQTASNNKAFRVLNNEKTRVQYILQEFNTNKEKEALDPMFLMEMMELNETLMEAKMEGKSIESSLSEIEDKNQCIWNEIAKLGKQHDDKSISFEDACKAIHTLCLQSNYMHRILENHGS